MRFRASSSDAVCAMSPLCTPEVANGALQLGIGGGKIGLRLLDIGLGRANFGLNSTDFAADGCDLLSLLALRRG